MAKEALKKGIAKKQNGIGAKSGQILPDETWKYDTHRRIPKADGGIYTDENTVVEIPTAHMQEHGTLRERDEILEKLKMLVDDREQVMKLFNKVNNQLRAYERKTDYLNAEIRDRLSDESSRYEEWLKTVTKQVEKKVKELSKKDPLTAIALKVNSIGMITVAYCRVYIDLEKARHVSSVWKYAGLHTASHKRYKKGETSGGNKKLRCVLWTMADSQMKQKNRNAAYGYLYDQVKNKLSISEKITTSRIHNKEARKYELTEVAWKDTKPSHRHGAALRAIMKHFLADYWFVGRTLMGLSTDPPYAEAILGKTHRTVTPKERGWEF